MRVRRPVPFLFALLVAVVANAQRPLTHDDYDPWKSIRGTVLRDDGLWVAYQIEPQWGDGELVVQQTSGDVIWRHGRGAGARFSSDGRYCVFTVVTSKVEERQKKIAELQKKGAAGARSAPAAAATSEPATGGGGGPRGPGPGGPDGDEPTARERGEVALLDLETGKVELLGKVKSWTLAEHLPWLVYHRDAKTDKKADGDAASAGAPESAVAEPEATPPVAEPATAPLAEPAAEPARRGGRGRRAERNADPLAKKRTDGTQLVVRDLATGVERTLDDVTGFGLMPKTQWLWYHTSSKAPRPDHRYGLFATRLDGSTTMTLVEGFADFSAFTSNRQGTALAFTCTLDDFAADKPRKDVWLWAGEGPAERIVHPGNADLPKGHVAAESLTFARQGRVLLVALQEQLAELPPVLAEDKVALDIWHWNDGELQTAQQRRGSRPPQRRAAWHLDERRLVPFEGGASVQVRLLTPDGSRALLTDGRAYDKLTSWDGRYDDVWLLNTIDGSRTKLVERLRGSMSNSPTGRYALWFGSDRHWWAVDVVTGERRDLTGSLPVAFHREDDDVPGPDPSWGIAGWTKGDAHVLLYDAFDVWQIALPTGQSVCVTDGLGREQRVRLRVQRLPRDDDDEDGALEGVLWLVGTNVETMQESVFADELGALASPRRLLQLDEHLGELRRAKKAERWCLTRSTFAQFPDLWTADGTFGALRRLSDANPQQRECRWGSAKLVRWTNADGEPLQGVLVTPDGFDPKAKYPMLVYFYERMSQTLHSYVPPAPGTSPNVSYYASNGYLVFLPDIVYATGYPGESCVKCVVSGVQSLIAQGFVDERAIGAAGHSWGGYQTAFLVTRTNIFAAVESGAPVCNMLSAYGGIRYETGVSRQFQYEQTQSRIGGTPWEFPLRYQENSPIWFADKVKTPVLILHNDKDGAVPWTQGLEFYTALRRLGREVYLCNYTGEGHGLRQRQNQKDWTRRLSEYFAHHLRGEPMPKWMQDGVPFRDRDREKLAWLPKYPPAEAAAAAATSAPATDGTATPAGDSAPVPAVEPPEQKRAPQTVRPVDASAKKPLKGEHIVLTPGKPAPDFAVVDDSGSKKKLADYRGKHLVVWFYPKADTPG